MVASRTDYVATRRVDLAVYQDDQLQLIVEVKARTNATAEWAAQMRRNLAAHLAIPSSPFFLLALPDHFYLWSNVLSPLATVMPHFDINPAQLLVPYIEGGQQALHDISEYGLTLAVSSWLIDLIASNLNAETVGPEQAWLLDSGLYRAIKGGVVQPQAAS